MDQKDIPLGLLQSFMKLLQIAVLIDFLLSFSSPAFQLYFPLIPCPMGAVLQFRMQNHMLNKVFAKHDFCNFVGPNKLFC